MRPVLNNSSRHNKSGFTLIEVLLASLIMAIAMSLVYLSFYQIISATTQGDEMLKELHHGEYSMTQVVSAIRSTAYSPSVPEQFEFWLEDDTNNGHPADIVSWVTSSSAFMPAGSPMLQGLHRIVLSIEEEDGESALSVTAYPHLLDPEDDEFEDPDPWIVSRRIVGLQCRVYDEEATEWTEDWEDGRRMPRFLEISLFVKREGEDGEELDPKVLSEVIQIPIATYVKNQGQYQDRDTSTANRGAAEDDNGSPTIPATPISPANPNTGGSSRGSDTARPSIGVPQPIGGGSGRSGGRSIPAPGGGRP